VRGMTHGGNSAAPAVLTSRAFTLMPAPLGEIWGPFHRSEDKPNGAHNRATHWRCIDTFRPANIPIHVEIAGNPSLMQNEAWFEKGTYVLAVPHGSRAQ
jgi:hypothetical protein